MKAQKTGLHDEALSYDAFTHLDGRHPWADAVPEGLIAYRVRRLPNGRVSYFNFELAKEMGLISSDHPHEMNDRLGARLLDTFALRIINEYDRASGARFAKDTIKPNTYMATRYLQMQHADKTGRTSGDGRAIWNGTITHEGRVWDVSSRGTGVTALSPGAVQAGQPLKSGSREFGYGCGLAEIDELYGAAIAAEIFHRNGIPTERVLAIIDLGRGVGIGVRAAPNLLRPAHLFLYSKQNKLEPLRRSLDYMIERQFTNRAWSIRPHDPERYFKMLSEVARDYARFAARLERDYIFAWLEWDGDNVLADAGIIDYGSIRQFGLRHDEYRYDDVDRYSTNLNEQRGKARDIVQTFVQMLDFAVTGKRRPFRAFAAHSALREFDREFRTSSLRIFLGQCGYTAPVARVLLNRHRRDVERLFEAHQDLERVKTHRRMRKVSDGIHRPAIFNMRAALAHLPGLGSTISAREFFDVIISSTATRRDRTKAPALRAKLERYQSLWMRVLERATGPATRTKTLNVMKSRARLWNHPNRLTGNALIGVVDLILRHRRGGLTAREIQLAIEELIAAQTLDPDYRHGHEGAQVPAGERHLSLLENMLSTIDGFREDI